MQNLLSASKVQKTILFFTPEAGVLPHFATQCVLARTLKEQGHRVAMVRCTGIFSRCPVMDMYQLPYDADFTTRSHICAKCIAASDSMLSAYGLEAFDFDQVAAQRMIVFIDSLLGNWKGDLTDFCFENVRFGEFCAHDVVLALKKFNFEKIDEETRLAWSLYIRNSLLAYLMMERICQLDSLETIVHFNDYSLQLGARMAAKKYDIRAYSVSLAPHKSADCRNILVNKDIWRYAYYRHARDWHKWRNLAVAGDKIREIAEDCISRMNSTSCHVYSPAKTFDEFDLIDHLGLCRTRKMVVAFSSSYDELLAGLKLVSSLGYSQPNSNMTFPDQISWIRTLIERIQRSDNLQLVVRIHPREGANKRDPVVSQHLLKLKEEFAHPPGYCRFIWPEDQISSYDLAEHADVALIGWSTIGLELARLGVPVLAINRGISFPGDDFIEFADTPEGYFQKLDEILVRPTTIDTVTHAFRYYNCYAFGYAIDLSDIIMSASVTPDFQGLPYSTPREAKTIERVIIGQEDILDQNYTRLFLEQADNSFNLERDQIISVLRNLFHYLMTGESLSGKIEFKLITNNANIISEVSDGNILRRNVVQVSGVRVVYITSRGETYERNSRMCARIACLVGGMGSDAHVKIKPEKRSKKQIDVSNLQSALEYARNKYRAAEYPECFDAYEQLVYAYPQVQTELFAEIYDQYRLLESQNRYQLYQSRFFEFGIKLGENVLDIGSGHPPFPFATHLTDLALKDGNVGSVGIPFKHVDGKPVYECSIEDMPFADKEFDFVYCSHVLEHVNNPEQACKELMRVGRRGFIESPTPGNDLLPNSAQMSNHRWDIELKGNTLIFTEHTSEEIVGFNCGILMDMNCAPQTPREKAFAALLNLRADLVNTMLYWEDGFQIEVHRIGVGPVPVESVAQPSLLSPQAVATPRSELCIFINTYYGAFLDGVYCKNPGLQGESYATQKGILQQECFGDSDFYSHWLTIAGFSGEDLIANCNPLQAAWAREYNCTLVESELVTEQIRQARPAVVYIQDMNNTSRNFLESIGPFVQMIVGQIATPVVRQIPFECYNVIFSSFPHYVSKFRQACLTSYYQPLAFDSRVLERITVPDYKNRPLGCSFVGGISALHVESYRLLEILSEETPIEFWGYGAETLPADSLIRSRHHGEAWGKEMFQIIGQSKITINRHGEVAENYANNMRLFEATGCGALLITDYKDNLNDLFEIGTEIVAFRSPEECATLVNYYLAHPDEAEAIARAGQARTLREHNYGNRMEQTAEILTRHLRYQKERDQLPPVDISGISYGHTPITATEVTSAMTSAWQSQDIPARQRALVQQEIAEMYRGSIAAPFQVLANILKPHTLAYDSILEIGCASGYYYEILEYLLNKRINYMGVDYSEAMIEMAKDYYPSATFFAADGANLFFADRHFRIVISSCILLHVPNWRQHVYETVRVADKYIVASRTPVCRNGPTRYMKKYAYGTETVELQFNEAEIIREFMLNGLELLDAIQYHANTAADEYQVTYLFKRI